MERMKKMGYLIKRVRPNEADMSNVWVMRTGKYRRCWKKYGMRPKYYGLSWVYAQIIRTGGQ